MVTKRRKVTLDEVRAYAKESGIKNADELGICALVDVEDMGYCKDGVTRYYLFDLEGRNDPCIYYKY